MEMTDFKLNSVLSLWGIAPNSITAVHNRAWDIDGKYVLKHGSNTAEIEKSIMLSNLLGKENIPVTRFLCTADNRTFVVEKDSYWCLMEKLKGCEADIYEQDESFHHRLGEVVANLHLAFHRIENQVDYHKNDLLQELESYILPGIAKCQLPIPREIIDFISANLKEKYPILPCQLIHRDMHMGNLLFNKENLSGYIDFDLSVYGVRVFDLSYLLTSLLVGKVESPELSSKWTEIKPRIISGYNSVIPLSNDEKQAITLLMLYIELLFIAFWTYQGNSEQTHGALKALNWLWILRNERG